MPGVAGRDPHPVPSWDAARERQVVDGHAEDPRPAMRHPRHAAEEVADELGATVASSLEEALAADVVATVTPGAELLFGPGSLRAGQHVSLMGADGPGKAEIAVEELARVRVFCDDWDQASHNGDLLHAVEAGVLPQGAVSELGAVLAGREAGRLNDDDITVFDSTGLAIQDLAVALAAQERLAELEDVPVFEL